MGMVKGQNDDFSAFQAVGNKPSIDDHPWNVPSVADWDRTFRY